MKKGNAPKPKDKPFAVNPFKGLKGVQVAPPAAAAPPPAPEKRPEPEVNDDLMFLRAMAEVRRLNAPPAGSGSAPRTAPPLPVPRKIDAEERQVFLDALAAMQLDVTFTDSLPDDVEPLRPLPVNRMRQLRRGAIRIDYELDLHGLGREEALDGLAAFIAGAHKRGQKAVLVITGKGNNSPGEPVLQGAVVGWLRNQGKGMVAEFSPAPRQMGGGGAFVVFLKDPQSAPA